MDRKEIQEKYAVDIDSLTLKRAMLGSNGNERKRFAEQLSKARKGTSNSEIVRKVAERNDQKLKNDAFRKQERDIEKLHQVNIRLRNVYKLLGGVEKTGIIEIRNLLARLIQTSEKTEDKLREFMKNTTNY